MNVWTFVIVAAGVLLGALLGRTRKCADGACPLTANPRRGALWGGILGAVLALNLGFVGSLVGRKDVTSPGGLARTVQEHDGAEAVAELTSRDEFTKTVLERDGRSVVYFYAEWCAACKHYKPILHNVAAELHPAVLFTKVNTDRLPELASEYGVMYLPTTVVIEKGEEVRRFVGVTSEEDLLGALRG